MRGVAPSHISLVIWVRMMISWNRAAQVDRSFTAGCDRIGTEKDLHLGFPRSTLQQIFSPAKMEISGGGPFDGGTARIWGLES